VVVCLGGLYIARAVRAEVELAQRRSDFAAAVTHELKTPLTTIRMYGEMLRDGVVADPQRQREYHGTLVTEAERLSRLVGNVLELARIERGTAAGEAELLEPAAVVREAATLVGPLVEGAGAALEVTVSGELPPVRVERDALVQALSNLVDNAVKFSASATDRRVHLGARREADDVAFVVRDHGPGVPRGQLQQIFEPFFRGERELTRRTTGTGIGLALVAGLAQRSGGAVAARNHPQGGLEVTLILPGRPR
jgi:signal transduction histidine kinase